MARDFLVQELDKLLDARGTNIQAMQKLYENVIKEVFRDDNAAFFGSLLCSLEFHWDPIAPDRVCTNGKQILWGPYDFLDCSQEERENTLLHEILHVGMLHHLRRGNRDPYIWNIACDYRINNYLRANGRHIPDSWVVDPTIDKGPEGVLAEEQIYDKILTGEIYCPSKPDDWVSDMLEEEIDPRHIINSAVRATQAAELAGKAASLPGGLKERLNDFLQPVIPWERQLQQWMTDLIEQDYSWLTPNRRYQDVYLPSLYDDEGRLEHLVFYFDTSGSMTERDVKRVLAEIKYVHEVLKPKKLTLVQFDHEIQTTKEWSEDEPFENVEIVGGGGTSLVPVKEHIEKYQPTAAIIFSDLECEPMEKLSVNVPVLWAVIRNLKAWVRFGQTIHITD